jgi:putative chitinase
MRILKRGAVGDDVLDLQRRLKQEGFSPGVPDGQFGGATEAAVIAFQLSEGLLADGIAGPRTLTALGLAEDDALPEVLSFASVQVVSEMFPATPVMNIRRNLPSVLDALDGKRLVDRSMVLMALATIRAETEPFLPLEEGQSKFNSSPGGHAFDLYDNRADLGNQGPPDGARYKGRGFIQLTGRENYRRYGPRLRIPADLEAHPDLAIASDIAAQLLALFLADKEIAIKSALTRGDLPSARRLVNGGTNGMDRFADAFARGDQLFPKSM